jgi:hypothetical protein
MLISLPDHAAIAAPNPTHAGFNTRNGKRMGPKIASRYVLLIRKDLLLFAKKIYIFFNAIFLFVNQIVK